MSNRRGLHALIRHGSILSSSVHHSLRILPQLHTLALSNSLLLKTPISKVPHFFDPIGDIHFSCFRHFSSGGRDDDSDDPDGVDDEGEYDDDDDEEGEYDDWEEGEEEEEDEEVTKVSKSDTKKYSDETIEKESAHIGYKNLGPIDLSQKPFKPYEPVFAVFQVGPHQFKVSNDDYFYTEKLKFCDVNDRIMLTKVLMLGTKKQTLIGRPILPDAAVFAVVEEQGQDAKVIIFKKKKRKNYRRTKGHRQRLTRLRILDIQGIEKPAQTVAAKPLKAVGVKQKWEPIAA